MARRWTVTLGLVVAAGLAPRLGAVALDAPARAPTHTAPARAGAHVEVLERAGLGPDEAVPPRAASPILRDPSLLDGVVAPDTFDVRFDTTEGPFVVRVHRAWAPIGADRFFGLVQAGFYDGTTFFRVIEGFVAQWGIHPDPAVSDAWREANLADDPVEVSNTRGRVAFAAAGPNTRTTQLFVDLVDNTRIDTLGFAPFGEIVEGMDVVERLHSGYGEGTTMGRGPHQARIQGEGDAYLAEFPELDRIVRAAVIER